MVPKNEILERIAGSTGLPNGEVKSLAEAGAASDIRERRHVYYQGDPAQGVHLILRGSFEAIKNGGDGNARLYAAPKPGSLCSLAEALTGGPQLFDLQSREAGSIFFIQRNNLLRLMEGSSVIASCMARLLAEEFHRIHENLEHRGPREKIISFLKARVETFGVNGKICRVDITQEQIAELVGYSRETVNRHLQDLALENRIALSRGAIEVGSIERLVGSSNR